MRCLSKNKISKLNTDRANAIKVAAETRGVIMHRLVGPLPRANLGMTCLLVVMYEFSKYVVVYPLRRPTTDIILRKILNEYIPSFSKPVAILAECGSQISQKVGIQY
jgi:hypothetical protein